MDELSVARFRKGLITELQRYLRLGWHIFPVYEVADQKCACGEDCGSPGKHPRLGRRYEPTNDERTAAGWWKRWPLANVGITAGPSDLIILDIDPRNDGDMTLAALEQKHGELPTTPCVLTGGGGQHYYFRRPAGLLAARTCVLGHGVEVKGDTGYVVAPPSSHYTGERYAWDAGRSIDDTELAEPPSWLLDAIGDEQSAPPPDSDPAGPLAGLIGQAFSAAGWMGPRLAGDRSAVLCPWRNEHTTGRDFDGSSIVFAPQLGRRLGWFHCSHAHCADRKDMDAVLAALPPNATAAARRRIGADRDALPAPAKPQKQKADESDDPEWKKSLRFKADMTLTRDVGNAVLILSHDPVWNRALGYDRFRENMFWRRAPRVHGFRTPESGRPWQQEDLSYVHHWIACTRGVSFSSEQLRSAVVTAAKYVVRDELKDWLTSLAWDGQKRLTGWLAQYMGARDSGYNRFVGRAWCISAVARALRPGAQVDHMLVLEGDQGLRKTSALEALVGTEWLLRDLPTLKDKDSLVNLCGKWVVNLEELAGLSRAEMNLVKSFLTCRVDTFRPPYGASAVDRPRRCVFAGTTNQRQWLTDPTGGRRFWPVRVGHIHIDELARDRAQLWAEARVAYENGEIWYPAGSVQSEVRAQQMDREQQDAWLEILIDATDAQPDRRWSLNDLSKIVGLEQARRSRAETQRIAAIMQRIGYQTARDGRTGLICYERSIAAESLPATGLFEDV